MNACTVHAIAEITDNMWVEAPFLKAYPKGNFTEVPCPTCWEVARESLHRTPAYILLCTPAALA